MRDENVRLTGFEAQLALLAPQARLDRDGILFAAGERSGRAKARRTSRWLASGNLLLVAALVGSWLAPRTIGPSIESPGNPAGQSLATASSNRPAFHSTAPPAAVVADGPTHLRLLQMLAGEVDGRQAMSATTQAPSSTGYEVSEPSEVRALLQRYLQDTSEQL
jgi:hypothetical protein